MRLIILIVIINFSYSLSKENIFEIKSMEHFKFNTVAYCDSDNFYITESQFKEYCQIKIFKLSLINNKIDSIILDVPFDKGFYCDDFHTGIYDIKVNSNEIQISLYSNIIFFEYDEKSKTFNYSNHYNLDELIKRQYPFYVTNLYLDRNTLIGIYDTYQKRLNQNNGIFIWKYDKNSKKLDTFLIPQTKGFKWTIMQPKSIIDYHKEQFVYCDLDEDNLYFFRNKDSITKFELNIFDNSLESVDKQLNPNHPSMFVVSNQLQLDSSYLVHRVDFLDENNILVTYSIPKTFDTSLYHLFNFCLVYKENNKWKVKDKINPEIIFGDNKNENKNAYTANFKVINGKLISRHNPSYSNKEINNFYRIEDVGDILERVYKDYKMK